MRETMADPTLARQAGRFVWLELDFDNPANQDFITHHGVTWTPSLFVLDPVDDRATATQIGGMTLPELNRFLDQGERGVKGKTSEPAAAALARGDEMAGRGKRAEAVAAYREALRLAASDWPERPHAVRSLTWALLNAGESQACAETAAVEAPPMPRESVFASVVLAGLSCANQGGAASWAAAALKTLEPLAAQAAAVPAALRDVRFQLYQQLMHAAHVRGDTATVSRWGERWLHEIETTTPGSDDERTALDIARVDAVGLLDDPARALPALTASEKAMPGNYNASLRLAEVATDAGHYDDALAACDRGLKHVTGPIGRTWLLETRAEALSGKGDTAAARAALEQALVSAQAIGSEMIRENHLRRIHRSLAEQDTKGN
jgi:predicted negative regulator of RcsB-dependent stress response